MMLKFAANWALR